MPFLIINPIKAAKNIWFAILRSQYWVFDPVENWFSQFSDIPGNLVLKGCEFLGKLENVY